MESTSTKRKLSLSHLCAEETSYNRDKEAFRSAVCFEKRPSCIALVGLELSL